MGQNQVVIYKITHTHLYFCFYLSLHIWAWSCPDWAPHCSLASLCPCNPQSTAMSTWCYVSWDASAWRCQDQCSNETGNTNEETMRPKNTLNNTKSIINMFFHCSLLHCNDQPLKQPNYLLAVYVHLLTNMTQLSDPLVTTARRPDLSPTPQSVEQVDHVPSTWRQRGRLMMCGEIKVNGRNHGILIILLLVIVGHLLVLTIIIPNVDQQTPSSTITFWLLLLFLFLVHVRIFKLWFLMGLSWCLLQENTLKLLGLRGITISLGERAWSRG